MFIPKRSKMQQRHVAFTGSEQETSQARLPFFCWVGGWTASGCKMQASSFLEVCLGEGAQASSLERECGFRKAFLNR